MVDKPILFKHHWWSQVKHAPTHTIKSTEDLLATLLPEYISPDKVEHVLIFECGVIKSDKPYPYLLGNDNPPSDRVGRHYHVSLKQYWKNNPEAFWYTNAVIPWAKLYEDRKKEREEELRKYLVAASNESRSNFANRRAKLLFTRFNPEELQRRVLLVKEEGNPDTLKARLENKKSEAKRYNEYYEAYRAELASEREKKSKKQLQAQEIKDNLSDLSDLESIPEKERTPAQKERIAILQQVRNRSLSWEYAKPLLNSVGQ